MMFKKFRHKENKKFFRKTQPEKVGSLGINYHTSCISCGDMFQSDKVNDYFVCEGCYGGRISNCEKCDCKFEVREEDKTWPEYCLNCVFEW
jgi:hypothetical protein